MSDVIGLFSKVGVRDRCDIAARLSCAPDALAQWRASLNTHRLDLRAHIKRTTNDRENAMIPNNESDTERALREYRKNWKPLEWNKLGLTDADIALLDASEDPNDFMFLLGGEVKFRRWTVSGYGAWEIGNIAPIRPSSDEGHYFAGVNHRGDANIIPAVNMITGANENTHVVYEYPLGHLDQIELLSLRVGRERRVRWTDANKELFLRFGDDSPVNSEATDNPTRICEYLKDNSLEPSTFSWRKAMHHDRKLYNDVCNNWWKEIDTLIAERSDDIRNYYIETNNPNKDKPSFGRDNYGAILMCASAANYRMNCRMEAGEVLW